MIYTLGSNTRRIDEFLSILKHYNIRVLIDVRRFPTSKFEWFKKDKLKKFVTDAGIEYVYLGNLLGGYREGGYEAYTKTEAFKNGINKIKLLVEGNVGIAIMCAEKLPWRCHRKFISAELERIGFEVIHIIERERLWKPK